MMKENYLFFRQYGHNHKRPQRLHEERIKSGKYHKVTETKSLYKEQDFLYSALIMLRKRLRKQSHSQ